MQNKLTKECMFDTTMQRSCIRKESRASTRSVDVQVWEFGGGHHARSNSELLVLREAHLCADVDFGQHVAMSGVSVRTGGTEAA